MLAHHDAHFGAQTQTPTTAPTSSPHTHTWSCRFLEDAHVTRPWKSSTFTRLPRLLSPSTASLLLSTRMWAGTVSPFSACVTLTHHLASDTVVLQWASSCLAASHRGQVTLLALHDAGVIQEIKSSVYAWRRCCSFRLLSYTPVHARTKTLTHVRMDADTHTRARTHSHMHTRTIFALSDTTGEWAQGKHRRRRFRADTRRGSRVGGCAAVNRRLNEAHLVQHGFHRIRMPQIPRLSPLGHVHAGSVRACAPCTYALAWGLGKGERGREGGYGIASSPMKDALPACLFRRGWHTDQHLIFRQVMCSKGGRKAF